MQAQTKRFVMPGAPVTGSGSTWADPMDLQTAINNSSSGDSVFVSQGLYQPASGVWYAMNEGVKIYGGFAGTELTLGERDLTAQHTSILKGNNARVIYNNNNGLTAAALLDGFTIREGAANSGGGMMNRFSSPTISNCTFIANGGGAVWIANSSTIMIKCIIESNLGNTINYGAGVNLASSGNAAVINCIFYNNTGYFAGGIYIDDIGPVSPKIINCTFIGNTATVAGGAAGIYCGSRSAPTIKNCIVWGNTSGFFIWNSINIPVITNNIIQGGVLGNLNVDPRFVDISNPKGPDNIWGTADDGILFQAGSPALNGGAADITGLNLPNTDIAGAARIQGSKIDMGVYESSFSCNAYTTLYVDSSIVASGDGGSWATAFKTLDEGLIAAEQCTNVNNIWVAKGTYQPASTIAFSLLQKVKIYGGFPTGGGSFAQRAPALHTSILKGSGTVVVYNESVDATGLLDGFTITGGASVSGGGMYNFKASPTINNCVFTNNAAAANGGAGGGIYNRNASPAISNCIFSNNSASTANTGGGGAIFNSNASPVISQCIFTNNTAKYGGAIYNYLTSSPIVKNTVFAGNIAGADGGAIANYGTTLHVNNVTFVNNIAGGGGGAIDNDGSALSVTNTLFWGNTATDANKDIWMGNGTKNITHSFTQLTWTGTGNIIGSSSPFADITNPAGADGIFYTADDGLVLKTGSTCINAGIPDTTGLSLGNTDILGNPRIVGAAIDLGAYEYSSLSLPVQLISFSGTLYNGVANLQWQTDIESNFHYFDVEKSTDGSLFKSLGKVMAKGNFSHYTFSTPQQEPGAYYRLKMVDIDGRSVNSRIIRLSQRTGNDISVYPNPATNYINLKVPTTGSMGLYAADGKLIKTLYLQAGVNSVDLSNLPGGLYYGLMNGVQVKFQKQ
jgi:parallel beta-helix repeat protein